MSCEDELQNIAQVPPSVQTVYCAMRGHDPMTGQALREATGLPRRTVYAALGRLRDIGVLQQQVSLRDARQTYFWVDASAAA